MTEFVNAILLMFGFFILIWILAGAVWVFVWLLMCIKALIEYLNQRLEGGE